MAVAFSATNDVMDPILADVVTGNQGKVVDWLEGKAGSWGYLASQAVIAMRDNAHRDLEDMERRLVWNRMWWWLGEIQSRIDGPL